MRIGVIELSRPSCPQPSSAPKRRNLTRKWRRSERVLVAVNLTEEGGELVTWALTDGSRSGDTVTVIHVVEPCPSLASRTQVTKWERQKKDMLNTLSELVTYCRTHYDVPQLSTVVQVVENKSIGDAIVQEAQNLEATRVILGKKKCGPLGISQKKMTDLGRLCVRNLEPYCDVVIVKKGKVLVRKPGKAKFRRSLETLILSTKKQELYDKFEETNNARELVGNDHSFAYLEKSRLGRKVLWTGNSSSDSSVSKNRSNTSSSVSMPSSTKSGSGCLSDHLSLKLTNSSTDSSFCSSGLSSGGSEDSPISVLRGGENRQKIDMTDRIDKGFLPSQLLSWRDTAASIASTSPNQRVRSRSSSTSLESVPELPEDRNKLDDRALVLVPKPQVENSVENSVESSGEDRKEEGEEENPREKEQQLALVAVSDHPPEVYDRKGGAEVDLLALVCWSPTEAEGRHGTAELGREEFFEERAIVLADTYPRKLLKSDNRGEKHHEKDDPWHEDGAEVDLEDEEEDQEGALVCLANCSPPKFARNCSEIRYNLSRDGLQSLSQEIKVELPEVRRFTYEELRLATDDFAPRNVVGTGGASAVYRARLSDRSVVAVKKLVDNMSGEKEFMMEMMMLICTLNHPNLVTMIGFCPEGPHRLIAYKLLTRGSLERNLHNDNNQMSISRKLNWNQRQKIAFGAARGLAYLHAFDPNPIVHRDIKTSNILLSDDFEAQISDFGLARWLSESSIEADMADDDQVSCAGTFGYLAPECLMYGGFNERTDVFAFGVVLLELISGRRPMDESLPETEQSLVLWARTLQQNGRTHYLVDRSMVDINPQQFKRMMYTAFLCVQVSPEDRPSMDRVVKLLDPSCNYSPAILQPNISAPPFVSMPEINVSGQLSREPSPNLLESSIKEGS
ncbi:unnamed protein product [Calypogeia fissa]